MRQDSYLPLEKSGQSVIDQNFPYRFLRGQPLNSFASKVDKRKIVPVNGEWKFYKENKEISTLTLKEAMLLFLSFCSRSVERSERSSQVPNNHSRMSSPAALLGHFISLTLDLIKKF